MNEVPIRSSSAVIRNGLPLVSSGFSTTKDFLDIDGRISTVSSGLHNSGVNWDAQNCLDTDKRSLDSHSDKDTVSQIRNKILSIRSVVNPNEAEEPLVGLSDIKSTILEAIVLPQHIRMHQSLLIQGILIVGPPGVAKTTLILNAAKLAATHLQRPISVFKITYSDAYSAFIGESEKFIRLLFEVANELQPSTILFDEVEGFMKKRDAKDSDHSTRCKASFLSHMQGFTNSYGVLVLATTNKPENLDDGFIRRFPERFLVRLPSAEDRVNLFRHFLILAEAHCRIDWEGINFELLAGKTTSFSGDDIRNVVAKALRQKLSMTILKDPLQQANQSIQTITTEDLRIAASNIKPTGTSHLKDLEMWARKSSTHNRAPVVNIKDGNKAKRRTSYLFCCCICGFACNNC